jgi:hypothetical protein
MLGIQPRAWYILGKHSNTELPSGPLTLKFEDYSFQQLWQLCVTFKDDKYKFNFIKDLVYQ